MNTLEGFAGSGFLSGDNVIVIATGQHLSELDERLKKQGFDVDDLIKTKNYMPLDAQATLDKFMVNNWPDEVLFDKFITGVINTASQNNKKVRAFGEMVDLLWQNGLAGATVKLEHLWCALHAKRIFRCTALILKMVSRKMLATRWILYAKPILK